MWLRRRRAGFRSARPNVAARTAQASPAPIDLSGGDPKWWGAFRDPILTSLARRVADANLDVLTATLRVAESRFDRGVTASAEFPSINGNASYQRELFSQNGVLSLIKPLAPPSTPFKIPPISVWQTGFDASWEIDVWGGVRRQIEAADAQIEVSEFQSGFLSKSDVQRQRRVQCPRSQKSIQG